MKRHRSRVVVFCILASDGLAECLLFAVAAMARLPYLTICFFCFLFLLAERAV